MIFRRRWLVALLLDVAIALVYFPGLTGGYAFDDFPNLVDNAKVHVNSLDRHAWIAAAFSSESSSLQRPIAMLTFAANYYFNGGDIAMKVTNLVIHAINSLLVLYLVHALLALGAPGVDARRRARGAAFVAAAWALHPINLTSVLYIVQRMESLAHTFVFGGLLLYLIGRQRQLAGGSGRWLIGLGVLGGTALGVLCKESAVLLPLYAWLAEACIPTLRNSPQKRDMRKLFLAMLWLPLLAGAAWLTPRVTAPGAFRTRNFNLVERLLTEGRVVVDYLHWSVLPPLRQLTLFHDDYIVSHSWMSPPSTLFSVLLIATLAISAWLLRARRPLTALGILWFFAAQALTATIVPLELVHEHRNYFASLGVCLVLGDLLLLARYPSLALQKMAAFVAVVLLIMFATVTYFRASDWSHALTFAASEASKRPNSPRAAYEYGRMLVIASKYDRNSPFTRPALDELERSRRLPHSGILSHSALLLLASHTGLPQREEWWTDMQRRLRTDPIGPQEISAIGSLARCARDRQCDFSKPHMIATFNAALTRPSADVLTQAGDYTLNVLRDNDEALAMFRQAVKLKPGQAQYRINLAKVLIALGHENEAKSAIATLRALSPVGVYEQDALALERRLRGQ